MKREQEVACCLNHGAFPSLPRPSDAGGEQQLLGPHKPGPGSTEAQLLLKQLPGIVAQNPPADHALRSTLTGRNSAWRGREIGVNFAGAGQAEASDFSSVIDGASS
jgi:hypothetical protein